MKPEEHDTDCLWRESKCDCGREAVAELVRLTQEMGLYE